MNSLEQAALPEPITPGVDNKKPASKPEVKLPFTDVSTSDWFYDDVAFVYENGLFSGTDSRSFSPNASMTRAMLVTVLYRLEGEPTVTGRSSFTDVRSGAYYEKSIRCGQAGSGRPQREPAAGKADGQPQALPERWQPRKGIAAL